VNPTPLSDLLTYLKSDSVQARRQAAIELSRRNDKRAVQPLLNALTDSDATVRANAAMALGQQQATEAVQPLLDILQQDSEPIVRELAADALGQIGAEAAVPVLIDMLDDENARLRNRIIAVLGASHDPRAIEPLIVLLNHDHPETRKAAAWALGALTDRRAIDPLRGLLNDPVPGVRGNVAWALGEFADPALIDDLLPLLDDPSPQVRGTTAWALGALGEETGDTRPVAPLVDLLDDYTELQNASAHVFVCQYAAEALLQIGTEAAERAVNQWKPAARERLLPRRIEDLIRALQHPEPDTRQRAIEQFNQIGAPAVQPLIDALQHHVHVRVRQGAAQTLGELGHPEAVYALVMALADADSGVWSQATAALAKLGNDAVSALHPALKSEKQRVKQGAAIALWRIQREEKVFRVLLQALQDDDVVVRGSAITSLWMQPDERAVATLQIQLQNEDGMMARYILQALQTIGGAAATTTVANWLADHRPGE
jgi:HEAT repeat protein